MFANVANANTINTVNLASTNLYANAGLMQALNSSITGNLNTANLIANGNASFTGTVVSMGNASISGSINSVTHITAGGNIVTSTGLISSLNSNVTGLLNAANASIGNSLSVVGNATAGNLETLGILNVRGNANVGNIGMATIVATGNANIAGAMRVNGLANIGNLAFPAASIIAISSITYSSTTITVTTSTNHGLAVGNEVVIALSTASTTAPNGVFLIASVLSPNSFTYIVPIAPSGTIGFASATLTVRPLITSAGSGLFDGRLKVGGNAEIFGSLSRVTDVFATGNLSANGTLNVSSITANTLFTFTGSTANVAGVTLTSGAITAAGAATFGGGNATFYANGQANLAGNVGAPHVFVTGNVEAGILKSSGVMFATGNVTGGNLVTNGLLTVAGNASVGNITATTLSGQIVSVSGNVSGANLVASGILSVVGNASVGNISAGTGVFSVANITTLNATTINGNVGGNGSTLTNINGANITGTVANASYSANANAAAYATIAFAVSGGNVSGNVNAALVAYSVAGGNIVGNVGAALTAYAVSGANVSGTVGSATNATNASTVTGASQPNITSVGTLSSLNVNGAFVGGSISGSTINGTNITASGFIIQSIGTGLGATGTVQSTALILTKSVNIITGASAGVNDGIKLPATVAGTTCIIINTTGVTVKVYPNDGGTVDSLAQNASFNLGAGAKLTFVSGATTQWYSLTAVYG